MLTLYLSDPSSPASVVQLMHCFNQTRAQNVNAVCSITKVLSAILQQMNPSAQKLIELSLRTRSISDGSNSGMIVIIGKMAEKHVHELMSKYLACRSSINTSHSQTDLRMFEDDNQQPSSSTTNEFVDSILFCLTALPISYNFHEPNNVIEKLVPEFIHHCLEQVKSMSEVSGSEMTALDVSVVSGILKIILRCLQGAPQSYLKPTAEHLQRTCM
jgi:hypothetical protein